MTEILTRDQIEMLYELDAVESFAEIVQRAARLGAEIERERAIADVDAEPEFPGEPPSELLGVFVDADVGIQALRLSVRLTKDGIRDRIRARAGKEGG